jgi:uncharacterized membrane protein
MTTPSWALTLSYWLHMLATVAWIGGLAAFSLLVVPLLDRLPGPAEQLEALEGAQRRLDPLGWFALVLLTATGLVQMSANPNYVGFLAIANDWALAILLKHVVFLGMVGLSAYITWGNLPNLKRAVLRGRKGLSDEEAVRIRKKNLLLLRINLLLGLVVLVFTAAARSA